MQSVGFDQLQVVAGVLEENEGPRAPVDRMTQELEACRECASHFKWVIKRQRKQLERLRSERSAEALNVLPDHSEP